MVITASPFVKTYTLEEFWELPKPPSVLKDLNLDISLIFSR